MSRRALLAASTLVLAACATDRAVPEDTLVLEMKPACLRCEAPTPPDAEAWICSYECTFCTACTKAMKHVCPNCGGELVARPRRD